MKIFASVLIGSLFSIGVSVNAHANWLVDEARWHVSAHGQIMCLDCHGQVGRNSRHPDPASIDRPSGNPFNSERCTSCHDAVISALEAGRHGGRSLDADQDYQRCLDCHHPHTQPRISSPGAFDPDRPVPDPCGRCHEPRVKLPALPFEDEACMACHRRWEPEASGAAHHSRTLCLACHGPAGAVGRLAATEAFPILNLDGEPHAELACLTCHPQAAQYGHARQISGDCRRCHGRHDEAVAHDAHLSVSCEACHLKQVLPHKQRDTGLIVWKRQASYPSRLHDMRIVDDETVCRRCHHHANSLGAAAMVLPAKSILCLPCHATTFSVADTITVFALIVFAVGMTGSLSYWFSGYIPGLNSTNPIYTGVWLARRLIKNIFSINFFCIAKKIVLQFDFYRRSPSRWLIHGMMVWPLGLRFLWGLAALLGSLWAPDRDWPWAMLNKNHPAHGVFFDMTGLLIIVGAAIALLRGAPGTSAKLTAMPRHDRLASALLGGMVFVGFGLEGLRIAMTGYPDGSAYAFVGDAISRLFFGATGLEDIYGYTWYIHAVLAGAFVAYLPFSRMFHILLAPVLLAMNAADGGHRAAVSR